ncbi:MAG: hypothetical protein HY360_24110 [Verrucomicrobia bacterium]|nr:hypothetical protein [Verrucomicrobiota bacterium]
MKTRHFEDVETCLCVSARRQAWQLARELTRLRDRSHFGVAKARPATAGRNARGKDNREP